MKNNQPLVGSNEMEEASIAKIRDLAYEINDSLPSIIDVACSLTGDNLSAVQKGLSLVQKQVAEIVDLLG